MATLEVKIYSNETIEKLANEILAHTGFLEPSAIDIVKLAKELGLNVYSASLNGYSGYIKFENGEKNIYINHLDSRERKRFTIAHELGHYLLHRNLIEKEGGTVLYRGINGDIIEQQANRCAGALLMPESMVKKYFNEINESVNIKISVLAKIFDVSINAMYTRLSILGLLQ